jgi:hypothetical protein
MASVAVTLLGGSLALGVRPLVVRVGPIRELLEERGAAGRSALRAISRGRPGLADSPLLLQPLS